MLLKIPNKLSTKARAIVNKARVLIVMEYVLDERFYIISLSKCLIPSRENNSDHLSY